MPACRRKPIFGTVSRKQLIFVLGLAGLFITPAAFSPLVKSLQSSGDLKISFWLTQHVAFWLLSLAWALFFGIWVGRSDWSWFASGDLKKKFRWILAFAVAARLAVVLIINIPPASDAKAYDLLAQNLTRTGTFEDGGAPTAFRPVGYVAFLAWVYRLLGHRLIYPRLANVLFDFFSLVLLWKLSARWKDERTAFKAVTITAFFVPEMYSCQYLLSEQLFGTLWMLCFYLFETGGTQKYRTFFSGIAFGLAALVRPVVLFWMGIPVLGALTRKHRLAALGLVLGALMAAGPWLYRNHQKFGIWGLSGHAGINFWMGANPKATGYYHMPDSLPFPATTQKELDRAAWEAGWDFVRNHPGQYLRLGLLKEAVTFGFEHNFVFDLYETPTYIQLIWGFLGQAYWWILLGFALFKGFQVLRNRPSREQMGSWLPFWTLLYWAAIHFFFVGATRYHHPVVPFFAYLAALTIQASPKKEKPEGLANRPALLIDTHD